MCSFDARNRGSTKPLLKMKWGIGKTRSWDHPSHPLLSDSSLRPCLGQGASLGEEAVLADSGWTGEVVARVGRVRSPAFLSILLSCGTLHDRVILRLRQPMHAQPQSSSEFGLIGNL